MQPARQSPKKQRNAWRRSLRAYAWIAVPSLIIVTALVPIIASYRIRRMEIRYGSD